MGHITAQTCVDGMMGTYPLDPFGNLLRSHGKSPLEWVMSIANFETTGGYRSIYGDAIGS